MSPRERLIAYVVLLHIVAINAKVFGDRQPRPGIDAIAIPNVIPRVIKDFIGQIGTSL